MLPQAHVQEAISRAYIRAVAARAGMNIQGFEHDYKTDGTFRTVRKIASGYTSCGAPLDFQLKSTVNCELDSANVKYDMKVDAYNALV